MVDFSLWDIFRNLLLALRWTVVLSLIAFAGGGLMGLMLLIARLSHFKGASVIVNVYVQLFQGTPLLMQLFLAYFGMARLASKLHPGWLQVLPSLCTAAPFWQKFGVAALKPFPKVNGKPARVWL